MSDDWLIWFDLIDWLICIGVAISLLSKWLWSGSLLWILPVVKGSSKVNSVNGSQKMPSPAGLPVSQHQNSTPAVEWESGVYTLTLTHTHWPLFTVVDISRPSGPTQANQPAGVSCSSLGARRVCSFETLQSTSATTRSTYNWKSLQSRILPIITGKIDKPEPETLGWSWSVSQSTDIWVTESISWSAIVLSILEVLILQFKTLCFHALLLLA